MRSDEMSKIPNLKRGNGTGACLHPIGTVLAPLYGL
jgi:hypothetical protein